MWDNNFKMLRAACKMVLLFVIDIFHLINPRKVSSVGDCRDCVCLLGLHLQVYAGNWGCFAGQYEFGSLFLLLISSDDHTDSHGNLHQLVVYAIL
jgi:hypothetical protein